MSDKLLDPFVEALRSEDFSDIPMDLGPPSQGSANANALAEHEPEEDPVSISTIPEPESFAEWGADSNVIKEPDAIISGLLPAQGKMILGGGSKSYKTWQLIDLALSVAHGVPWMGLETVRNSVLYIDLEFIPAFFKKRMRGVAQQKGLGPTPNLDVWHLRGIEYNPTVLLQVMQTWDKKYGMVIIDPFYKMNPGGDENANGEVTDLLLKIERFAEESAVVFAHHFAKGDLTSRDPIDRCSGAGAFARDPDVIVSCTRHEVERALTIDYSVRNYAPVPPGVVRFDKDKLCMVPEPELNPDKLHKPGDPFKTLEEALDEEATANQPRTIEALAGLAEEGRRYRRFQLQKLAEDNGWTRHEFDQAMLSSSMQFEYLTEGRNSYYVVK